MNADEHQETASRPKEFLRERQIFRDLVAHELMPADRIIRVAPDEYELSVRYDVLGAFGVADVFRPAKPRGENRKELWLNDSLPEAVNFLMSGERQQIGLIVDERVHGARKQVGLVPRVGIGE